MGQGTKRSPGVNLLLFIVTFGVYWFFWLYKAFTEVAEKEQKPFPARKWLPALAILWVVAGGIGIYNIVSGFRDRASSGSTSPGNPFANRIPDFADPFILAAMAVSLVFYLLQLVYVKQAHAVVEDAAKRIGDPNPPNGTLAILFNVLAAASQIPLVGSLIGLGATVCAIIWVVQTQAAMNRYWDRTLMAPPAPPPGWMQPPMAAPSGTTPPGYPPVRR